MNVEQRSGRSRSEEQPPKECLLNTPKGQWTATVVSMNVSCIVADGQARYSVATADPNKVGFLGDEIERFTKQCEGLDECLLAQICRGKNRRNNWLALPK